MTTAAATSPRRFGSATSPRTSGFGRHSSTNTPSWRPAQAREREDRMVASSKRVGAKRYRESFGRHYEDFVVGDVYEHRPGRTITEADNVWFTLLTMNTHPLHFDHAFAEKSEFGKPVVNRCLTL